VESTLLAREGAPSVPRRAGKRLARGALGLARAIFCWPASHDLLHAHDGHGHTFGAIVSAGKLVVSRRVAFPVRSRLEIRAPGTTWRCRNS
jgi:hypothetical protein